MATDGRFLFAIILQQVFMHIYMHPVDCSFDYDLCGWSEPDHLSSGDLRLGTNGINGYLKLGSSYWSGHTTHVESVAVQNASIQCLKFYYMTERGSYYNSFSSALKVGLVYNNSEYILTELQEGNFYNEWQPVLLNINNMPNQRTFKIRLSASISNYDGMNIDNIQLMDGFCRMDCDFEDFCGWMIQGFSRSAYYNGIGHYLLAKGRYVTAQLTSPLISLEEFQCMTILYKMSEDFGNKIEVLVRNGVRIITLEAWTESADQGYTWQQAFVEIEVTNTNVITIVIQVLTGQYYDNWIGLDNISITRGSCIDCTFSEGFCNWEGGPLWEINKNAPVHAYTRCTSPRDESSLISKSNITPGPKCLSFKYFIEHSGITFILLKSNEGMVLSNKSDIIRNTWTELHTNINLARKSKISISFVHITSCYGQYAIMSISLKKGFCPDYAITAFAKSTDSITTNQTPVTNVSSISSAAVSSTFTTTTIINASVVTDLPSGQGTDKLERKTREDQSSSRVAVGVIVGIVIGCLALAVAVLSLFVYWCRRRRMSSMETKTPENKTVANTINMEALRIDNTTQNASSSFMDQNKSINEISYYNPQAEYSAVDKKKLRKGQSPPRSVEGITTIYLLTDSKLDNNERAISKPGNSQSPTQNIDLLEESEYYDTLYEAKDVLPDSTYDHTNVCRDGTYDSTTPGTKITLYQTYNHTTFETNVDDTCNRTRVTNDNTYNTSIWSSNQDAFIPTYDLAVNDDSESTYEIIHTQASI